MKWPTDTPKDRAHPTWDEMLCDIVAVGGIILVIVVLVIGIIKG